MRASTARLVRGVPPLIQLPSERPRPYGLSIVPSFLGSRSLFGWLPIPLLRTDRGSATMLTTWLDIFVPFSDVDAADYIEADANGALSGQEAVDWFRRRD